MNINGILSWLVPVIIILAIAAMFYTNPKIKEMVHVMARWIGGMFAGARNKMSEKKEQGYDTVYTYG